MKKTILCSFFFLGLLSLSGCVNASVEHYEIADLSPNNDGLSDAMKEALKGNVPAFSLKADATLYSEAKNVTPASLKGRCEICRFGFQDPLTGVEGATYLLEKGHLTSLGISFGGYGVNQFAYSRNGSPAQLYFVYSWGSGVHRAEIGVYDFASSTQTSLALEETFWSKDACFVLKENGTEIAAYEATLTIQDDYTISATPLREAIPNIQTVSLNSSIN